MNKYLYSIIYVFSTALSIILIEKVGDMLPPALALLISTLFATIFFHILNLNSIISTYKKIFQETKNWIACSFVAAVIWLATFYGIKVAGGFNYLFIYFITAAIISYVILMINNKKTSFYKYASTIGLILLLAVFIYLENPYKNKLYYDYGILLALIGGISSYIYRKLAYVIVVKSQLTASQVLAVRSYGIIILAVMMIPHASYALLSFKSVAFTIAIATFSLILPLYSNQRGIAHVGPEIHSIISSSCPLVTCLLYFIVDHLWSPMFLISSIIAFFLLILGIINPRQKISTSKL